MLGPGDLVVYDRGYYCRALLQARDERRVETVFRPKRNASRQVRDFIAAGSCDQVVTMQPFGTSPLRLRLVKYAVYGTPYVLGTTLLDAEPYPLADLAALYHGRWRVEELYKISKELLQLESFHARSEQAVQQELYAHFTPIAMARLFASHNERQVKSRDEEAGRAPLRANFNSKGSCCRHCRCGTR